MRMCRGGRLRGFQGLAELLEILELAMLRQCGKQRALFFLDVLLVAIAEHGPAEDVLVRPANPRTRAFLSRFHHAGALRSAG